MNASEHATSVIKLAEWQVGRGASTLKTFLNSTDIMINSTTSSINSTISTVSYTLFAPVTSTNTAFPLPNPSQSGFTLTEIVIMSTAMVILIMATLFGNCLVLGIFYQYTPLRTVTNYFIVSLANADLLVAVLSIPIWIAYLQVDLAELTFGEELYRFWICLDITTGVSSVLNLSFVSVDRYVHIAKPLHYHSIMTSKRAKVIIICIWMYAVGLALVKGIAFHWEKPNYEILVFVMGFVLPLSVMGWCYYKIFGEARIHAKALKDMDNIGSRDRKKQFKAAKTIAVVIFAFFLCWCPFFALNLVFGLYPTWQIPGALITVSKWLHYTNSALNPIIYTCFNQEYRSAFRALLTRKRYQSERLIKKSNSLKKMSQRPSVQENGTAHRGNETIENAGLICKHEVQFNKHPSILHQHKLDIIVVLEESTV